MAKQQTDQLDPLSRLLSWITYQAAIAPKLALGSALIITCAALWLATTQLEFRTSRLDLLSAKASYNQRWLAYLDKFGKQDDAVVIVSHSDPAVVSRALTDIGQRLESDARLHDVLYRKSMGQVADKALGLLPTKELEQLDLLLVGCLQSFSGRAESLPSSLPSMASALTQAQLGLDQLKLSIPREGSLLLEDDGRLGICLLRVPHLDDEPIETPKQLTCIQSHIDAMRASYPEVEFGLTGMPALEWDESRSSQADMQKATLLSLLGVAVIFVFGFGTWRMPCAAVFCLAIGLIWTVGLATLIVGHLNLFSVAFGAIIAGLGIDYAIHLLARLHTQDREALYDPANSLHQLDNFKRPELSADELPSALARAVAHCGKGIFTGAVTTAAAFGVAVLTPFRGMTELGVICAAGTMTCMAVTIWILPAVISLQAQWLPRARVRTRNSQPREPWLAYLHQRMMRLLQWSNQSNLQWRVPVLLSTLFITVMSGMQIGRVKYDHNLLNLQAENAPSVVAERALTSRSQHSAWFAVSMARSASAAKELRQRLESLPSVARVEELGSLMVQSHQPRTSELVGMCRTHAQQLMESFSVMAARPLAASDPGASNVQGVFPASFNSAVGLDPHLTSQLQLLSRTIADLSVDSSLATEDFPSALRSRMISQDGQTYLLRVFAKEDLWERANLGRFVRELESVDPRVTGHPIQTWYASAELESSYYQAGIYALMAVIALLMIDLGSLRLVALALLPVTISAIQLCGWLVAWEIPFNAANLIVLPLIIGIGIDDGVHIMHDFQQRGTRAFRLSSSTTLAVLLTSLTTMVGFGSMAVADHRGLFSLGIVLMTGVGLCLWHSWFTLPALLSFLGPSDHRKLLAAQASGQLVNSSVCEQVIKDHIKDAADSEAVNSSVTPLLLRDIPVVFSLPDYPELRSGPASNRRMGS